MRTFQLWPKLNIRFFILQWRSNGKNLANINFLQVSLVFIAVKSSIDFLFRFISLRLVNHKDTKTQTENKTFINVYSCFEEKFSVSKILKIFYILRPKIPEHTNRFLVEMFHNYALKECISVENLKLWLLILTKTLY